MMHDYLSDRWMIHEGDKWSLKEDMICGTPQGSWVDLFVWNVCDRKSVDVIAHA